MAVTMKKKLDMSENNFLDNFLSKKKFSPPKKCQALNHRKINRAQLNNLKIMGNDPMRNHNRPEPFMYY